MWTCKPTAFGILAPRFSRDADGKVPAACGGTVGEALHFKLKVVGFDKSSGAVKTKMTAEVLDADDKVVGKPLVSEGNLKDPAEAAKAQQANFAGTMLLNRSGDFRLRITVEDAVGKQKTTLVVPLKVNGF